MYVRPTLTGLPSSSAEGGLAHFVGGGICLVAGGKDEHSLSSRGNLRICCLECRKEIKGKKHITMLTINLKKKKKNGVSDDDDGLLWR